MKEKIFLYTFIDNDYIDSMYNIITNKNCDDLIQSIEDYYYNFEDFETIDELTIYLKEQQANIELVNYISQQDEIIDLTISGICGFTMEILENLNVLLNFESKIFRY